MVYYKDDLNPYDLFKIQELTKCSRDPVYFINSYFKFQHPLHGEIFFNLCDTQKELIETFILNRYTVASLPRQFGKTTIASAFLLWKVLFNPNFTALVCSHSFMCATEILSRIKFAYENLPELFHVGIAKHNKTSIIFDNDSRIIASTLTQTTGQGMYVSLLYLDEFAFVEPKISVDFWSALAPTLSIGGDCIITSTPNNESGQFYNIWKNAKNNLSYSQSTVDSFVAFTV